MPDERLHAVNPPVGVRAYRLLFGVVALIAVIAHYFHVEDPWGNWISTFTVQGNVLTGVVLVAGALLGANTITSSTWDKIRGATVMYMVLIFFVYGFLINGFDNPFNTDRHWTHTVLHQLMPLVAVLDAVIRPFVHRLDWRVPLQWMVYPLLYLAYSLVRGAIVGWYPYDFINPNEVGGYSGVALYCVGITVAFLAVAVGIVAISRLSGRT